MQDTFKAFRREQSLAEYKRVGIFLLVVGIAYLLSTQPVTMTHIMVVLYGAFWYQEYSLNKSIAEIEQRLSRISEQVQTLR